MFTAKQAAQKVSEDDFEEIMEFTAEQAAQKILSSP